jgi:hypothetical protein
VSSGPERPQPNCGGLVDFARCRVGTGLPGYAVHAVKREEITATTFICQRQKDAEDAAMKLSTDPGVLAGAVTMFVLDKPGHRTAVALDTGQGRATIKIE